MVRNMMLMRLQINNIREKLIMMYELYFLNNIHDSIEMVNVEIESFLDLSDEEYYSKTSLKHIILNLANCLELLLKFRLENEHWSLVFSDVNKAVFEKFICGDFISVDFKSGLGRLKNICDIQLSFTASMEVYQLRNRLMHYTLNNISFSQIVKIISMSMLEIIEFVNKEIIQCLPQDAIEDFKNSIIMYKSNADLLNKLEFDPNYAI